MDAMPMLPSRALYCYLSGKVNRRVAGELAWLAAVAAAAGMTQCLGTSAVEHPD